MVIAAGARSRHVVVRGGGEAATGRMPAVAASWACWRVVPTVWQSIKCNFNHSISSAQR